jgi:hypothetical protein
MKVEPPFASDYAGMSDNGKGQESEGEAGKRFSIPPPPRGAVLLVFAFQMKL